MNDARAERAATVAATKEAVRKEKADSVAAEQAVVAVLGGGATRADTARAYKLAVQSGVGSHADPFRVAAARILLDQADSLLRDASSDNALAAMALALIAPLPADLPKGEAARLTKLQERASAGVERAFAKAAAADRRAWADNLEKEYLRQGMDVTVAVRGENATTLRLKWILVSRPLAFQLGENPEFWSTLRAQGFNRFEITDGYDEEWSWTL